MPKESALRPVLAPGALQDLRRILQWSERNFGKAAAARYRALIKQAVREIGEDPERAGTKEHAGIMVKGARTYHVKFSRDRVTGPRVKEPRHLLVYRRKSDGIVEVGRILDDVRDIERHLPEHYRTG